MLINCAGGAVCGKLEDTSPSDIQVQWNDWNIYCTIIYVFLNFLETLLMSCNLFQFSSIQNQLSMNFVGTVYPTKAIIARMKSRGEGIVVITGSVASLFGIYGFSIYSSSKFALRGFAEALHMEVLFYVDHISLHPNLILSWNHSSSYLIVIFFFSLKFCLLCFRLSPMEFLLLLHFLRTQILLALPMSKKPNLWKLNLFQNQVGLFSPKL